MKIGYSLIILFVASIACNAEESMYLLEFPLGYEFNNGNIIIGGSYRYLLNSNGKSNLSFFLTPKAEASISIPDNGVKLTVSPVSYLMMVEPELSIQYLDEFQLLFGLEFDLFVAFSAFLFGDLTSDDGKLLKRTIEPYFQIEYGSGIENIEFGIRFGYFSKGILARI